MLEFVVAVRLPLIVCDAPLEEQISKKRAEVGELQLIRERATFDYGQSILRYLFDRNQLHQRGVKLEDDSAVRRQMQDEYQRELQSIDQRSGRASRELQVLECRLERKVTPAIVKGGRWVDVAPLPKADQWASWRAPSPCVGLSKEETEQ